MNLDFDCEIDTHSGGACAARYNAAMLKYLRIAVTALSLTACLLLVALWVRSYWRIDELIGTGSNTYLKMSSERGRITYGWGWSPLSIFNVDDLWREVSYPDDQPIPGILGFYYGPLPGGITFVRFPYWFLVFVTAATAVSPWCTWRWSFGLRTLLIVTALVAMVLGLIVLS
jgi:hypothetical protein